MAKSVTSKQEHVSIPTGTSIDIRRPKFSTMNKHKKRSFKAYRGQGRR
jgi:hypothetical protein